MGICYRALAVAGAALLCGAPLAGAQEIRIGYAAGSPADRAAAAFIRMVNDDGGIGGRTLVLVGREESGAALIFSPLAMAPGPRTEARIFAHYVIDNIEAPKIVVLHPDDASGRDAVEALRAGLGDGARRLVSRTMGYDPAQPTVEFQVTQLRSAGGNVFVDFAAAKFAAQAIRKVAELGWSPIHMVASASAAAGPTAKGVLSAQYLKMPNDPQWQSDAEVQAWRAWMRKYLPDANADDPLNVQVYVAGHVVVEQLRRGGPLKDFHVPMLLPGIAVSTGPDANEPIKQMQMMGFTGDRWLTFGPVLGPGVPPSVVRNPGTSGAK